MCAKRDNQQTPKKTRLLAIPIVSCYVNVSGGKAVGQKGTRFLGSLASIIIKN